MKRFFRERIALLQIDFAYFEDLLRFLVAVVVDCVFQHVNHQGMPQHVSLARRRIGDFHIFRRWQRRFRAGGDKHRLAFATGETIIDHLVQSLPDQDIANALLNKDRRVFALLRHFIRHDRIRNPVITDDAGDFFQQVGLPNGIGSALISSL